jgi:hypothetical protein
VIEEEKPLGDWNLIDEVRFKECSFRVRNVDTLRITLAENVQKFMLAYQTNDWQEVRPKATKIKVEAETVIAELKMIDQVLAKVEIPESSPEASALRDLMRKHVQEAVPTMEPVLDAINTIISEEDKNG